MVKVIQHGLNQMVDPKKGYNNAKFEIPHLKLNRVHEKAQVKSFCQIRKHIHNLQSLMCESKQTKKVV